MCVAGLGLMSAGSGSNYYELVTTGGSCQGWLMGCFVKRHTTLMLLQCLVV